MLGGILKGLAGLFGLGAPPGGRHGRALPSGGRHAFGRGAFGRHGHHGHHGRPHWRRPFFGSGGWLSTGPWYADPVYYEVPVPVPVEDPCIEASRVAAGLLTRAGIAYASVSPAYRTLPQGQTCFILVRTKAPGAQVFSATGNFVHGFQVEIQRP